VIDKMTVTSLKYVGAGIILMRPGLTSEDNEYLVLKGRDTGIWSFSKGHPEACDGGAPLRTAVRETQEETGLEAGIDYDIVGNSMRFGKRPYWIGVVRADAKTVTLSSREHSDFAWNTWSVIADLQGNSDVRIWVKKSQSNVGDFSKTLAAISSLQARRRVVPVAQAVEPVA